MPYMGSAVHFIQNHSLTGMQTYGAAEIRASCHRRLPIKQKERYENVYVSANNDIRSRAYCVVTRKTFVDGLMVQTSFSSFSACL